jgi:hypothetical protein
MSVHHEYEHGDSPDITDLNDLPDLEDLMPLKHDPGSTRFAGGALVSHLAEPVYIIAFKYGKKIADKTVIMQFVVSGFNDNQNHARTEQIERAFGDTHKLLVHRQLDPEDIEPLGGMVLRVHNGVYAAPLTRGSAIYQYWTKSF